MAANPHPLTIKVSPDKRILTVAFDDGTTKIHTASDLRVNAPSADVQGHGGHKPPAPTGKENITITYVQPVGHYAVRIVFSDGHDRGLYTWEKLYSCI